MRLKFLGKTMKTWHSAGPGEVVGVTTEVGKALVEAYPQDFEEIKEHAPGANKMYSQTASFKSK